MLRSVGAVISGWLVFAISTGALFALSGRKPHEPQDGPFIVFSIVYGALFAALGGFLAAAIGRGSAARHGAGVAVLLAGIAITSALASGGASNWSQIGAALIMAPAAYLGARARARMRVTER